MMKIDVTKLNAQERHVLDTISAYAKSNAAPRIVEAAALCGCSVSQVSKTVKKAGFGGYKQYIRYLYYGDHPMKVVSGELDRLKRVIDEFDVSLVQEFVGLIKSHDKILLFGYGPTHICAQYFEYKLRFYVDRFISTPPDEASVRSMADDTTLVAIFTTTGQYRSFDAVSHQVREKGADVVVVSEEYNPLLMESCDRYMVLSHHRQDDTLSPHEKTRTVIFIFIEQVLERILAERKSQETGGM